MRYSGAVFRKATFTHSATTLTDLLAIDKNILNRKKTAPQKCDRRPVNRLVSLYNTNQSLVSSVHQCEEANISYKKNLLENVFAEQSHKQIKVACSGHTLR